MSFYIMFYVLYLNLLSVICLSTNMQIYTKGMSGERKMMDIALGCTLLARESPESVITVHQAYTLKQETEILRF